MSNRLVTGEELPSVGRKTSIRDLQLLAGSRRNSQLVGGGGGTNAPRHTAKTALELFKWDKRSKASHWPQNSPEPDAIKHGLHTSQQTRSTQDLLPVQVPDSTAHKQVLGPYIKCFECDSNIVVFDFRLFVLSVRCEGIATICFN